MPLQTETQKKAAYSAAGLNFAQQVEAGTVYASPISSASLTPTAPLKVNPVQPPPPVPVAPPPVAPAAPSVGTDLSKRLEESIGRLSSKDATANAQSTAATAGFDKQLGDINKQIEFHQANAIANQEAAAKRGETLGFASREQQAIQRTDAIESLRLTAQANYLQGNIQLADKQARAAVDAQFALQQQDIQTQRQNIIDNYDSFTASEKKRADAALLKLDKDDAFVAQTKADRTAVGQYALIASKYGAPQDVITKAQAAKTPEDALTILGAYMQDPKAKYELESARLENILKQKEIAEFGQPTVTEKKDALALDAANKTAVEVAGSTLNIATQLRDMVKAGKGNSIIGGTRILNAGFSRPGSDAATVQAKFDQLKDSLALGNIDKLKGAMSDKDIEFLRNTASSIRLNLSEKQFVAELNAIIGRMEGRVLEKGFASDERAALDALWATSGTTVNNPAAFF